MNNSIENRFASTVQNSRINSRIESVDDPVLNRKLFSFYECLVQPFREVEALYDKIERSKREIENNKTEITCVTIGLIKRFIIIDLITLGIMILLTFGVWGVTGFDALIFLEDNVSANIDWVAIIYLWIPVGVGIAGSIIYIVSKVAWHKSQISICENDIFRAKKEIEEKLPALCEVSCIIPPNYRYSNALAFFVDAYSNSKVDNLKEAVNLFDTHDYRRQMLESQQMVINHLQQVEFNQMMLYDQLDRLNRNIWFSEAVF